MSIRHPRRAAAHFAAPAAALGALAAVVTAAPAQAAHTVEPGDTVFAVGSRYGIATADLLAWNGLTQSSVIHPGQKLRLLPPDGASSVPAVLAEPATATHSVVRGDTVFGIARRYGTTVAAIMSLNRLSPTDVTHLGQQLRVATTSGAVPAAAPAPAAAAATAASAAQPASAAPTAHTVVAGDTLFGIAEKYATTVGTLLQHNGLGEGSIIYPGQTLRLAVVQPGQRTAALDATQAAHAAHIIRVGRELGVPDRGIAIALATAMVESSLRNLDHGDRDSLGLFQQRPNQGWGTPAQIMDADRSIRVFYGGPAGPNRSTTRGLLDIAGWQSMSFTDAAQAVQVSAFPERYGQWEQQAVQWLGSIR